MILLLIACYIFILIMLIALEVIPISVTRQKKRLFMVVLSIMDIGMVAAGSWVQKQQEILGFLFLPLVVLGSSLYELYRESLGDDIIYYFSIPAHSYNVKKQLGMDLIIKPMMKCTTAIIWDGKRILMPQIFSANGEALELTCYRMEEMYECYYCRSVTIVGEAKSISKMLLPLSLLVSVLAIPLCFYLSKIRSTDAEYWIGLGSGFATCLVFGFAKQVFAGKGGSIPLQLMRSVVTVFYGIGLLGVILKIAGI